MEIYCPTTISTSPSQCEITDDPIAIFRFAVEAFEAGPVALVTLTAIEGGAAKNLGSHMAVAADGRFCGYVSGGCVETAVAFEALLAIEKGADRTVCFGSGSPLLDIALPCGGCITLSIHVLRNAQVLEAVIAQVSSRLAAGLVYSPTLQSLALVDAPDRASWDGRFFLTCYTPSVRMLISGASLETLHLTRVAEASGMLHMPIGDVSSIQDWMLDSFSAVVLLHHDLDREEAILRRVLSSPVFYIGALGSTRTHRKRVERLIQAGVSKHDIDRIKAPIGMFGPTKDAASLAASILADVVAAKLMSF